MAKARPLSPQYDLVVIGSGPGGQRAAIQAAKLRKRVLLIEKYKLGGSSVHWGTIPSKTLREAALHCQPGESLKTALNKVMAHKDYVVAAETDLIKEHCASNQVDSVIGTASFVTPTRIQITTKSSREQVDAKKIILATGTRPAHPEPFLFDGSLIYDSDQILKLKKLPPTLLIVGAGVIGCEYASIFARLGCKVTLVDRRGHLLRTVDTEVVDRLRNEFKIAKIELVMPAELGECKKRQASGSAKLELTINNKKRTFDAALICMGRDGNVSELNLPLAGLASDNRGLLKVNEYYQTRVPHIYAVGDLIGAPALAASSAEQGRLAACHAFGEPAGPFPASFPYGIYTIPEISTVGALESELTEKGIPFVSGRAEYKELARGLIQGDERGFLKMIFHRETRKLLGIHIIGSSAAELVHIGQVAFSFGATIDFFINNVFNYPTLAEAYKVSAYNARNQL